MEATSQTIDVPAMARLLASGEKRCLVTPTPSVLTAKFGDANIPHGYREGTPSDAYTTKRGD